MKKNIFFFLLLMVISLLISGCNSDPSSLGNPNDDGVYGNQMDYTNDAVHNNPDGTGISDIQGDVQERYNASSNDINRSDNATSRFGFVRYNKDQIDMDGEMNHAAMINREQIANVISRMLVRINGIQDAATLVTDEHVLIAYTKEPDLDRDRAADIVKQSAMAVVPRYYHVYVSDNPLSYQDIKSLSNSSTTETNYKGYLKQVIDHMLKSPQGNELNSQKEITHDDMNHTSPR